MSDFLYKVLLWVIAIDVFALGVMIIFLINARINLKRDLKQQEFFYRTFAILRSEKTCDRAAERLKIPRETLIEYCKLNNIELPEDRVARMDKERRHEEEEKERILNEEAAWRAEQERIIEERKKSQEEEARKRKERLRKFGFK